MPKRKSYPAVVIENAIPTVFLKESQGNIWQAIDLHVSNPRSQAELIPVVSLPGNEMELAPVAIPPGRSVQRVLVPEMKKKTDIRIGFKGSSSRFDLRLCPVKRWNVHLVQNAHFDPGYTDLPSRVMDEYMGFFDDVLRFCDETDHFPDETKFRYQVEQSWQILHTLERRPKEIVDRLAARMREGRIAVNALYCNIISEMCSSEELARLLYPAFQIKRRFGIPITTAEHNDIPGVSWGIAQSLVSAGIKYFAPALPTYFHWGNKKYPIYWDDEIVRPTGCVTTFRWQAPDGRSVLFYIHDHGAGGNTDRRLTSLFDYLREIESKGYPYSTVKWYQNGAHRDNAPPCVDYAYAAREHNNQWSWPRLRVSTNDAFFTQLENEIGKEIQTFRGELPGTDYPVGALSSARETGINRVTHDRLVTAEKIATLASAITRYDYPAATINRAWEDVMRYDEHAFGMGYPLGAGHEACASEKNNYAYHAAGLTEDLALKSLNRLADEIALPDEGIHLVVFNSLSRQRSVPLRVPVRPFEGASHPMFTPPGNPEVGEIPVPVGSSVIGRRLHAPSAELLNGGFDLIDTGTGKKVPHQVIRLNDPESPIPHASARFGHGQKRSHELLDIEFNAKDLPACGYKTYRMIPRSTRRRYSHDLMLGDYLLEGPFYRIELDPDTGDINSLYDKELKRELYDPSCPFAINELVGRSYVTGEVVRTGKSRIVKGDAGPVSASLVIRGEAPGCPRWTREIKIYQELKQVDFNNRILKDANPGLELYFAFPFAIEKPRFRYEGALSTIEPIRDQLPGTSTDTASVQHFAHVYNNRLGVTWSSRDAHLVTFSEMWPGYVSQAHHNVTPPNFLHPFLRDPDDFKHGYIFSYIINNNFITNFHPSQNGDMLFRYSITSHRGDWNRNAQSARDFGWDVMNPPESAYIQGPKPGSLPPKFSFLDLNKENVVVLALKKAEDGQGIIVRLQETAGRATNVRAGIHFMDIRRAYETNLVEENERLIKFAPHWVEAELRPWGVTTLRLLD